VRKPVARRGGAPGAPGARVPRHLSGAARAQSTYVDDRKGFVQFSKAPGALAPPAPAPAPALAPAPARPRGR